MLLLFIFAPTTPPQLSTLSLHDALPISFESHLLSSTRSRCMYPTRAIGPPNPKAPRRRKYSSRAPVEDRSLLRSEEHTSELQSRGHLVCRLLLEKKKKKKMITQDCIERV